MKKTMLAFTAVAGLALSGAGLASSQAAPAASQPPAAVQRAAVMPSLALAPKHCSDYPSPVYSPTTLVLRKHVVRAGHKKKIIAVIKVRSQRPGYAQGTARLRLAPLRDSQPVIREHKTLHKGKARIAVSAKKLSRGEYRARAFFIPKDNRWQPSKSDIECVTVRR